MPRLGEIRRASEIGRRVECHPTSRKTIKGQRYIWHACVDCGKERWVVFRSNKPASQQCKRCHILTLRRFGSDNKMWAGGRCVAGRRHQYISIKVYTDDFFYSMADNRGYVLEHRLVMAKHLGRCLHRWELVHHRNGVYLDNRIENLQLISGDRHRQITLLENRIRHLEARNKELREKLSKRK